jgi:hypothetical protein
MPADESCESPISGAIVELWADDPSLTRSSLPDGLRHLVPIVSRLSHHDASRGLESSLQRAVDVRFGCDSERRDPLLPGNRSRVEGDESIAASIAALKAPADALVDPTEARYRTPPLTCRGGTRSYESGRAYMPARSGAEVNSALDALVLNIPRGLAGSRNPVAPSDNIGGSFFHTLRLLLSRLRSFPPSGADRDDPPGD